MLPKVDGRVIRERGRIVREIGERMSHRFKASQQGRRLRGLTVDDGQSVVTGNFLKLRLNVRQARNEWVDIRVEGEGRAALSS